MNRSPKQAKINPGGTANNFPSPKGILRILQNLSGRAHQEELSGTSVGTGGLGSS